MRAGQGARVRRQDPDPPGADRDGQPGLFAERVRGVISLNGQMVELLHLAQAERLLAMDDAIRQLAS
jgi:hypothetical protein